MEPCRTEAITIFFNFPCSHSCLKILTFFFLLMFTFLDGKNVTFIITNRPSPISKFTLHESLSALFILIFKEILLVWKTPLNAPLWNNISP